MSFESEPTCWPHRETTHDYKRVASDAKTSKPPADDNCRKNGPRDSMGKHS
ncbi:hypothetical protein RISK_001391 [Rhodopirellula islandica]|uniref:Uncharacterized protein n=1 Tax=Rhodopirellula islandica TaxID=595434 RepID=A0A0J1BJA1_RHOIS|nr:hypothetical protein RISK_001391 [Rhodopirellula islandica]